ncbi:MAG: photosystem II reaction centre N prot [Prochlorococcus sp. SP3034]|nr:photosystem II reaction centre N prot [Prochlorococcus sp. SP3034]|tara:strand:- start:540 stop:701 length:162 start_codon:yes stop_codon:yes gene_type:complete
MLAIALGMNKVETFTVAISSIVFIGAFTWVSIKGDLRKIAEELINDTDSNPNN